MRNEFKGRKQAKLELDRISAKIIQVSDTIIGLVGRLILCMTTTIMFGMIHHVQCTFGRPATVN